MTSSRTCTALDLDTIHFVAPSVFATTKHESRSDRFAVYPTVNSLRALMSNGFVPVNVTESRTRTPDKRPFVKHQIRLRRTDDLGRTAVVGDVIPEIVLTNASDGTSAFLMRAGLFRWICANGMLVGDSTTTFKVYHKGNEAEQNNAIIEAAYEVTGIFDKVEEKRELMLQRSLGYEQKCAFAEAALALKYGDAEPTVDTLRVLHPRRPQDIGSSVWHVFNVLQENLLNGGMQPQRTPRGKRTRTTRKVTGIDAQNRLNTKLWALAEVMATA